MMTLKILTTTNMTNNDSQQQNNHSKLLLSSLSSYNNNNIDNDNYWKKNVRRWLYHYWLVHCTRWDSARFLRIASSNNHDLDDHDFSWLTPSSTIDTSSLCCMDDEVTATAIIDIDNYNDDNIANNYDSGEDDYDNKSNNMSYLYNDYYKNDE